ncbi:MAG TPA: methionine--tRNA ligase [Anaerolineaceae bacterium]|jgi:methionyl-tRNA synthetase|nr:methionine--tRNA ligase [Anaerolineaceae bacterium]
MNENILIAIAWPYANADIHVGNITGSHLPGDIVARYHRLRGRNVLMVSGADAHGTPITIKADQLGKTPTQVYESYQPRFVELFERLGISYDLFTSTHTENHFEIAQKVFVTLLENGYLHTEISKQWFSEKQQRFLPDRYVVGTCYLCGAERQRSDQCELCGQILDPEKLIDPISIIDESTPVLKETEHYYLDLRSLEPKIRDFLLEREDYWRPNVMRQSLGNIESVGLKPTSITRDLQWGIPVPLKGWENKVLYVWFEAVMGYLSATIEWSSLHEKPNAWRDWWTNPDAKAFYFIGKDNITFHAVTWPAELLGMDTGFDAHMGAKIPQTLNLPYNVPANEFMNLEGRKISGSANWAVWGLDILDRYDADAIRYYLTVTMPETRDTDWDWEDFFNRNNSELLATWGNLANRVLSFTYKNWDGVIPAPEELRDSDKELLQKISDGFDAVAEKIEKVELRNALGQIMDLATEVNKYLDVHAPWFEIKSDRAQAEKSVFTAIQAIEWLNVMFAPFLPHTSEALHKILNHPGTLFGVSKQKEVKDELGQHLTLGYELQEDCLSKPGQDLWQAKEMEGGREFNKPTPLIKKLDASIIAEERARLG